MGKLLRALIDAAVVVLAVLGVAWVATQLGNGIAGTAPAAAPPGIPGVRPPMPGPGGIGLI